MSLRSKGKTTSFLIMGLVMYEMYGTVTQYIRQNDYLLTPKYSKGLYNIVNSCGYVPKITGGRWDAVVLKARRWYYCKYDDNGKIAEMSKDYVCIMSSIDKQNDNKSLINEPRGDLIIYDEFINKYYLPDEFIELSQLISSIRRIRKSPIIILLSNTVDGHRIPYGSRRQKYNYIVRRYERLCRNYRSVTVTTPYRIGPFVFRF